MKEGNIYICPITVGVNWAFHTHHSTHKYGAPALPLTQISDTFALEGHGSRVKLAGF